MKKENLTKEQEAKIYCIKNGHANYVSRCFGYIHCGRCGQQIGDQLGGVFDTRGMIVIGCKEKNCKVCPSLIKKLSPLDKKVFNRINRNQDKTQEEILKGVDFNG